MHQRKRNNHTQDWDSWSPSGNECIGVIQNYLVELDGSSSNIQNQSKMEKLEKIVDIANLCEKLFASVTGVKIDIKKNFQTCYGCCYLIGKLCTLHRVESNDKTQRCVNFMSTKS